MSGVALPILNGSKRAVETEETEQAGLWMVSSHQLTLELREWENISKTQWVLSTKVSTDSQRGGSSWQHVAGRALHVMGTGILDWQL